MPGLELFKKSLKIRGMYTFGNVCAANIRVFHKPTALVIMSILASEALLRENKKIQ